MSGLPDTMFGLNRSADPIRLAGMDVNMNPSYGKRKVRKANNYLVLNYVDRLMCSATVVNGFNTARDFAFHFCNKHGDPDEKIHCDRHAHGEHVDPWHLGAERVCSYVCRRTKLFPTTQSIILKVVP